MNNLYVKTENVQKESYRNITIDILKFLACLGVVCIHFSNNPVLINFSRVWIPFYFLVSGFLGANLYDKNDKTKKLIKQIKTLAYYTIIAFLFIVIYSIIKNGWDFNAILSISGHLWFLGCLMVVNIVYYFACKFNKTKILFKMALPLLFIGVAINVISNAIFNFALPFIITRNALFMGIPFFVIGVYIAKNNIKIKNTLIKFGFLLLSISFMIVQIFEARLVCGGGETPYDLFFSSIISSVLLFLFAISFIINVPKSKYMKFIGRNYTLYIYLYHQIIVDFCINVCHFNLLIGFIATAIVCYFFQQIWLLIKKYLLHKQL